MDYTELRVENLDDLIREHTRLSHPHIYRLNDMEMYYIGQHQALHMMGLGEGFIHDRVLENIRAVQEDLERACAGFWN